MVSVSISFLVDYSLPSLTNDFEARNIAGEVVVDCFARWERDPSGISGVVHGIETGFIVDICCLEISACSVNVSGESARLEISCLRSKTQPQFLDHAALENLVFPRRDSPESLLFLLRQLQ